MGKLTEKLEYSLHYSRCRLKEFTLPKQEERYKKLEDQINQEDSIIRYIVGCCLDGCLTVLGLTALFIHLGYKIFLER